MNLMDEIELFSAFLMCFVTVLGAALTWHWRRRLYRATDAMVRATQHAAEDAMLADWARRTTLTVTRADAMIEVYTVEQLHEAFPSQRTWASPVAVTVWTRSPHTLSIFAGEKSG